VDDFRNENDRQSSTSSINQHSSTSSSSNASASVSSSKNKRKISKEKKKKGSKNPSNGIAHTHSFNHIDELDRQLHEPNDNSAGTDNDMIHAITTSDDRDDHKNDNIASSTLNDTMSRQSSVSSNHTSSIRSSLSNKNHLSPTLPSRSSVNNHTSSMLTNNSNNVSPSRLDSIADDTRNETEQDTENDDDADGEMDERKTSSRNLIDSPDSLLAVNRYTASSTSADDDNVPSANGVTLRKNIFRERENSSHGRLDETRHRSPSAISLNSGSDISSTTSSSTSATVLPQASIVLQTTPRDTATPSSRHRSSSSYIPRSTTNTASPSSSNPISFLSTLIGGGSSSSSSSSASARDALINSRASRQGHHHPHTSNTSPPPSLGPFNRLGRSSRRFHGAASGDVGDIHIGVSCDLCQSSPIRGVRYKCEVCRDYDLCSNCYTTFNIELNDHKPDHQMRRIERSHRSGYSSQAEQFIRMLLNAGYNNVRLVSRETDPEYEERYRAFMEEAFYNGPKVSLLFIESALLTDTQSNTLPLATFSMTAH
jgi:hypothetical protein